MLMEYSHLVMGGTFDHLHLGHQKLLETAFSLSKRVWLGLTTSAMHEGKAWSSSILPFEERKREIEAFCKTIGREKDIEIVAINDVYGSTLENKEFEAILVTPHSYRGAEVINIARKEKGLPILPIHICELLTDNSGQVLSSTRIRGGLVNRSGFVYSSLFHKTIVLSQEAKEYVRKTLGVSHFTFPTEWDKVPLIFVGDVVTQTALKMKLPIASAWVDGKSQRASYELSVVEPYILVDTNLTNDPGTINESVASFMLENLIKKETVFKVEGEEDLLTLVAILLSPLGSIVTYGNPYGEKGVTLVHITEEKKEEIRGLIEPLLSSELK